MPWVKRFLSLAVVCCLSTTLLAEAPTLLVTDGGYYLLVTDAAGRPVVQEFARVVTLGKPTTPTPQPPGEDLTAKARGVGRESPGVLGKAACARGDSIVSGDHRAGQRLV